MSDDQLGGVFPNLPRRADIDIKATATFYAEDVQDAFKVTKAEAEAWLLKHHEIIACHMLDVGYAVIVDLGIADGLTPIEEEA